MDFNISSEVNPGKHLAIIRLEGELDAYTSETVRETVIGLVRDGYTQLLFDLGKLSYLDSSGLGVLVGALKRVREREGDLVLVVDNPRLLRLFELTGLEKIFNMVSTRQEALGRLEGGET
jgi:anti-sigma B factor antagonist